MKNLPVKKDFLSFIGLAYKDEDGLTRWLKSISLLSLLVALLIFADYFLPLKPEPHIIKKRIVRVGFSDLNFERYNELKMHVGEEEFWLIMDGEDLAVNKESIEKLSAGDKIILHKTPVFGINVNYREEKTGLIYYPYINVYGFFLIFPFAFLLLFVLMQIFRKKTEPVITIGVINIFLLIGFGSVLLFY